MALSKETRNYEMLLRFNENGKIGAQRQSITEFKDGGTIVSATPENPEPLTLQELQDFVAALTPEDWFVPATPDEVVE